MRSLTSASTGHRRAARLTALCICIALHALLLGGVVRAADAQHVAVYYGDLDLSGAAGSKALYSRLAHAAELVCGPGVDNGELRGRSRRSLCISAAIENAVRQVNWPAVPAEDNR